MPKSSPAPLKIAIVGAGPAGLMAAETIAAAKPADMTLEIRIFERMPSPARKLLMAGRGGLNITHSEPIEAFQQRYGAAADWIIPYLTNFPPAALRAWCEELGQPTFIGSSGRVFPEAMKASPLLRAWLRRLDVAGVTIATRATWTGWDDGGALSFADGGRFAADATLLALGGASWPKLGSDGHWASLLPGIEVAPFLPANCGFAVAWSEIFRGRHAGTPLKRIALSCAGQSVRGEAMITAEGIEGGAVYAISAAAREAIAREGRAVLEIDLKPDMSEAELKGRLEEPRRGASLANFLRKRIALQPVAIGLVQETLHGQAPTIPLPRLIKALPVSLTAPFGLARAISTAGGIALSELDEHLMLKRRPGVFAAGEMLDWEAPTGGYLLQACLATGRAAGLGMIAWLRGKNA